VVTDLHIGYVFKNYSVASENDRCDILLCIFCLFF
jgi:hypothetical protein